ncbi:uncharacterized protein [Ambystoma mexicanum]|uniref:uncharacterized protein n=1 Tax=Ambystoma mexicanum TaxID=8296 RepID=UPI0037E856F4
MKFLLILLNILRLNFSSSYCGIRTHLGGSLSNQHLTAASDIPWLVSVTGNGQICAGSIINNWWILTAASCLLKTKQGQVSGSRVINGMQGLRVDNIFIHHDYISGSGERTSKFDIGLILLQEPLTFHQDLWPAYLPGLRYSMLTVTPDCWVLEVVAPKEVSNHWSGHAHRIKVQLVEPSECLHHWPDVTGQDLCARNKGTFGGDCQVRLGSPLICFNIFHTKWVLVGLLARVLKNCDVPALVTRTSSFTEWIMQVTKTVGHPFIPPTGMLASNHQTAAQKAKAKKQGIHFFPTSQWGFQQHKPFEGNLRFRTPVKVALLPPTKRTKLLSGIRLGSLYKTSFGKLIFFVFNLDVRRRPSTMFSSEGSIKRQKIHVENSPQKVLPRHSSLILPLPPSNHNAPADRVTTPTVTHYPIRSPPLWIRAPSAKLILLVRKRRSAMLRFETQMKSLTLPTPQNVYIPHSEFHILAAEPDKHTPSISLASLKSSVGVQAASQIPPLMSYPGSSKNVSSTPSIPLRISASVTPGKTKPLLNSPISGIITAATHGKSDLMLPSSQVNTQWPILSTLTFGTPSLLNTSDKPPFSVIPPVSLLPVPGLSLSFAHPFPSSRLLPFTQSHTISMPPHPDVLTNPAMPLAINMLPPIYPVIDRNMPSASVQPPLYPPVIQSPLYPPFGRNIPPLPYSSFDTRKPFPVYYPFRGLKSPPLYPLFGSSMTTSVNSVIVGNKPNLSRPLGGIIIPNGSTKSLSQNGSPPQFINNAIPGPLEQPGYGPLNLPFLVPLLPYMNSPTWPTPYISPTTSSLSSLANQEPISIFPDTASSTVVSVTVAFPTNPSLISASPPVTLVNPPANVTSFAAPGISPPVNRASPSLTLNRGPATIWTSSTVILTSHLESRASPPLTLPSPPVTWTGPPQTEASLPATSNIPSATWDTPPMPLGTKGNPPVPLSSASPPATGATLPVTEGSTLATSSSSTTTKSSTTTIENSSITNGTSPSSTWVSETVSQPSSIVNWWSVYPTTMNKSTTSVTLTKQPKIVTSSPILNSSAPMLTSMIWTSAGSDIFTDTIVLQSYTAPDVARHDELTVILSHCGVSLEWNSYRRTYHLSRTPMEAPDDAIACGQRAAYIPSDMNSQDVETGEFPWMVSLSLSIYHFCAGSILNRWWILTTANCANVIKNEESSVLVHTGILNLQDNTISLRVQMVLTHVDYREDQESDNLGLLMLQEPLLIGPLSSAVCVAENIAEEEQLNLTNCWIAGWTALQGGPTLMVKHRIDLFLRTSCNKFYKGIAEFIFCVNPTETDKGHCQADIGSPLVCEDTFSKSWLQIGILSDFDTDCQKPFVFLKLSHYMTWVEKTTQMAGKPYTPPDAAWITPHHKLRRKNSSLLKGLSNSTMSTVENRNPHTMDMKAPWQCLVVSCMKKPCGGSILSELWILTTASCVLDIEPDDIVVYMGLETKKTWPENVRADRIFPHELYQESRNRPHNIALILLRGPIIFDNDIGMLSLWLNMHSNLSTFEHCGISGMRSLQAGNNEDEMDETEVIETILLIKSGDYCLQNTSEKNEAAFCFTETSTEMELAKFFEGNPILCQNRATAKWFQVGTLSQILLGDRVTAVFTIVTAYAQWINKTSSSAMEPLNLPPLSSARPSKTHTLCFLDILLLLAVALNLLSEMAQDLY